MLQSVVCKDPGRTSGLATSNDIPSDLGYIIGVDLVFNYFSFYVWSG